MAGYQYDGCSEHVNIPVRCKMAGYQYDGCSEHVISLSGAKWGVANMMVEVNM